MHFSSTVLAAFAAAWASATSIFRRTYCPSACEPDVTGQGNRTMIYYAADNSGTIRWTLDATVENGRVASIKDVKAYQLQEGAGITTPTTFDLQEAFLSRTDYTPYFDLTIAGSANSSLCVNGANNTWNLNNCPQKKDSFFTVTCTCGTPDDPVQDCLFEVPTTGNCVTFDGVGNPLTLETCGALNVTTNPKQVWNVQQLGAGETD
ncbi:hypothetical protein BMF94_1979 [Rhodotorula taiwanensis]|uniref:Ricin B lectin domain-containing protein n=1 Tax=Rhodotorula taiwanensis TaxID=741276 RepID=A0A2S5BE28_9BASI|nr:hypothetical protein BMF94_1979 [Rhodotorula taiwanensis]